MFTRPFHAVTVYFIMYDTIFNSSGYVVEEVSTGSDSSNIRGKSYYICSDLLIKISIWPGAQTIY
jgi:hypothetical protein